MSPTTEKHMVIGEADLKITKGCKCTALPWPMVTVTRCTLELCSATYIFSRAELCHLIFLEFRSSAMVSQLRRARIYFGWVRRNEDDDQANMSSGPLKSYFYHCPGHSQRGHPPIVN